MKKIFALGVATAAVACATPAAARDVANRGGFSVGVVGGYDHVTLAVPGDKGSKDGFVYGIVAGYDYNLGQGSLGVEAEVDGSTTKERNGSVALKAGRDLYAGVRAAYAVNPQVSVYAKGGYTNARLNLEDGNTSYGFNNGGFRLGGGVEVAVSQPIVARLEYRYSDYGRTHIEGQDTGISIRRHQVVAALVTRF